MRVHELIDILSDQPADAEVELAVIAPVEEESDDITVDRYFVDGVLPWEDDEDDEDRQPGRADHLAGRWRGGRRRRLPRRHRTTRRLNRDA